jgi:enediyne biosynthesis protein E4
VHAGSSYLSSEDLRVHFGLGGATKVRELVVRWPGGGKTRLTGVAANQLLEVKAPS